MGRGLNTAYIFYGFVDYIFFLFNFKQIFSRWEKFAWIRIEIFGRIRIRVQWIRIQNTAKFIILILIQNFLNVSLFLYNF